MPQTKVSFLGFRSIGAPSRLQYERAYLMMRAALRGRWRGRKKVTKTTGETLIHSREAIEISPESADLHSWSLEKVALFCINLVSIFKLDGAIVVEAQYHGYRIAEHKEIWAQQVVICEAISPANIAIATWFEWISRQWRTLSLTWYNAIMRIFRILCSSLKGRHVVSVYKRLRES